MVSSNVCRNDNSTEAPALDPAEPDTDPPTPRGSMFNSPPTWAETSADRVTEKLTASRATVVVMMLAMSREKVTFWSWLKSNSQADRLPPANRSGRFGG